ncbi:MAG: hypothetical protein K6F75_02050 [Butyrivibrio sp.]|nr:hypothetical protein [Butyrivibrio sp.]
MTTWHVMRGEKLIAIISGSGKATIARPELMPFDLWVEETEDIDTLVNNVTNFNFWCASRVLTLDRKYAKEILGSIGASQGKTDKERAQIALSYHCLSLTDDFWAKEEADDAKFADINLFENHLDNAFVDVSLRGKSMTIENAHLIATDTSTSGVFPKAWLRKEDGFYLYKDGDIECVENEILASEICRCFDCNQVLYELDEYDGEKVSSSRLIDGLGMKYSMATRAAFDIYAVNHDLDPVQELIKLDAHDYYMMNILDYLVGNIDRHWENWGVLVDNESGEMLRLYDLMDFNQAFKSYDTEDGAMCQTTLPRHISQKQAAIEAVKAIGLNQVKEIDMSLFGSRTQDAAMFEKRLQVLRENK